MDDLKYKKLIRKLKLKNYEESYFLESTSERKRNKFVLDMFKGVDKNAKILNVGDGTGTISLELEKIGFRNIVAIDINKEFLAIAKKRCKYTKFIYANAHNLPFDDNKFDIITYVDVIEFLDFEMAIKEAYRVTNSSGIVYFENFNKLILTYLKKIPLLELFVESSKRYKTQTNFNAIKLMKQSNFKIKKFEYLIADSKKSMKRTFFKLIMRNIFLRKILSPVSYFYLEK